MLPTMQHRQRRDRAAAALGRAMRQQAEDLTRMADNLLDEVPDATVVATQAAHTMACLVDYAASFAVDAELDEAAEKPSRTIADMLNELSKAAASADSPKELYGICTQLGVISDEIKDVVIRRFGTAAAGVVGDVR